VKSEHFPSASYDQLFPKGAPAWKLLEPEDDGSHHSDDDKFFEWWYFDVECDNGYRLVADFHTAFFGLTGRPPLLAINVYAPDRSRTGAASTFHPLQVESATDRCDVRLGASRVSDAGDRYIVHLEQGHIQADIEYHKNLDGVQIGTGTLFEDQVTGQSFHWIIPLPRARVSGTLCIDGAQFEVNGTGYHDHNCGNVDLCEAFDHWRWGRVVNDQEILIFGHLVGHGNTAHSVSPVALWVDQKLMLSSDQLHVQAGVRQNAGKKEPHPPVIEVSGDSETPLVRATFRPETELDVIHFVQPRFKWRFTRKIAELLYFVTEKVPFFNHLLRPWIGYGTYHRFEAGCELTVAVQEGRRASRTVNALCEIMGFHSAP